MFLRGLQCGMILDVMGYTGFRYHAAKGKAMKRVIMFVLCCVCINAYAYADDGWERITSVPASNNTPSFHVFVKKDSIADNGKYRSALILNSLDGVKQPKEGKPYRSMTYTVKYDCKEKMASLETATMYEKPMAGGHITQSNNLANFFQRPASGSTSEITMNHVCAHKAGA